MNIKGKELNELIKSTDNKFVSDFDMEKGILYYTRDFYVMMYKLMENGSTAVEAYEALGFNVKKLGRERADQAGKRAKKLAKAPGYTTDPSSYDGSISLEEMKLLTTEEEHAYLIARNRYLETMLEFQKKMPSILEELSISLKKKS